MKSVVLALLALIGLAAIGTAPALAAPPVSAFARLPAIEQAAISPDGSRVAMLGGPPGERTLFLAPVDGKDSVTVKLGQAWIRSITWVGNGYVVVNFSMMDRGTDYSSGREYAYQLNRNVVIDMQGKLVASLLANTDWSRYVVSQPILAVLDGPRPSVIVLGLDLAVGGRTSGTDSRIQPKGGDLAFTQWRVDVASGQASVVEKGNAFTRGWELDLAGGSRVRWDYDGDLDKLTMFVRGKGKSGWSALGPLQAGGPVPDVLGYSDPDDSVYLLAKGPDGVRLFRRSLADGSDTPVVLDRPAADLGMLWDPHYIAAAAIVTETDRPAYQWLDPKLAVVHTLLAKAFPGRDVRLASWSRDKTRVVIRVESPDSPPVWFLFDTTTKQASALGEAYPELAGATLGTTTWITYKARDGREIPAYLTMPPGLAPGARPPLVVMPHGGPAVRDHYDFDWWVQALAVRGYAVLRPQFRGSGGFGDEFQTAGYRQWGGKMQEDLIDGVIALADRGVVDRKQVAIAGASYGGYAAMFGATVYPTFYRCGVSVNGVSDLALLIGGQSRAYGRDTMMVNSLVTMMGDPRNNAEAYRLGSPVFRITGQTAPMLLIHGEEDTVVPIQQSQTMVRALKAAGRPVEFVSLKDDNHNISSTVSRTRMLESTLRFLSGCLPVGS